MKSVLLSIKPKYCMLIANGKKTVEVRKTRPKINTPFKCYIYCTKERTIGDFILTKSEGIVELFGKNKCVGINKGFKTAEDIDLKGKVIGEFVCDEITTYPYEIYNDGEHFMRYGELEKTCLDGIEIYKYLGTKDGYGWHISNLVIYGKPKDIDEFQKPCSHDCKNCKYWYSGSLIDYEPPYCEWEDYFITRPPQSWCYVEEAKS